ncbi:hypothetical protein [Sandarakinorhabdus sp.]|uniref:Flp family type IVb pilin n=1 Tax=Sandarakinorhabdus sp. TaxID=1916663 RepID=UPI00286E78EE|nr:hypothetical protein [Sandarakinorhabdus sp.]
MQSAVTMLVRRLCGLVARFRTRDSGLGQCRSGASAAEYALIVAVMGGFVVGATTLFGGSMQAALKTAGDATLDRAKEGAKAGNVG